MSVWVTLGIFIFLLPFVGEAASKKVQAEMADGKYFSIAAEQDIKFVSLQKIDPALFDAPNIPRVVNLIKYQSSVKSQGQRGSCTYFAFTSLVESLIKRATGKAGYGTITFDYVDQMSDRKFLTGYIDDKFTTPLPSGL